jgi:dihydrofolate reductase
MIMRRIIYYVGVSLDGYIAGVENGIDSFIHNGPGADQFLEDLKQFDTVIMGRKTYEAGYRYGLMPGQLMYANMKHYIFSSSLRFEHTHPDLLVCPLDIELVKLIKRKPGGDIYLCGGGKFAGWLLHNQLIDVLKTKLNPVVLGAGTKLFGSWFETKKFELMHAQRYADGLQIAEYRVNQN